MKKSLLFLLLVWLMPALALAEGGMIAPFAEATPEAKIAQAIADSISLPCAFTDEAESADAANQMLSDPSLILCDTQSVLAASLQGYTDEDPRAAMSPLFQAARSPLVLVMDKEAAASFGITDAESFLAYIQENEYSFLLARHINADAIDRAATLLSNELPLLTDYFLPEEVLPSLHAGDVQAGIIDAARLTEAADKELLLLCTLGEERTQLYPDLPCAAELDMPVCQDVFLGLYMQNSGDQALIEKARALLSASDLEQTLLPLGYVFSPLDQAAFDQQVRDTFADYKRYMTAEGLFFYEE